mmetsp:Transcript_14989/g.33562  ORF Transcript_14989/g.33562 Transcript_14989/m.33562 type:complete len:124 (-) Transcript_14989:78-449(-)
MPHTAATRGPSYSCCESCGRFPCGIDDSRSPEGYGSRSRSTSRLSSVASSYALPNAYAMVATSFADSKSRAVRDWNEGRCRRAFKSKSLVHTAIVAAFFREELMRVMASSRSCPRVAAEALST